MAQLVKSRNGATKDQLSTLDSLGLRKVGHGRPVGGERGSLLGALHKVRDRVRVYPLVADAVGWVSEVQVCEPEHRVVLEPVQYEVKGHPGMLFEFGKENFVRCELNGDSFSFGWSTGLPIASVLDQLDDLLPSKEDGTAIAVVEKTQDRLESTPQEMVDDVLESQRPYAVVRFEWPTMILVWAATEYPEHVDERILPGYVAVIENHFDRDRLRTMIHQTATVPVDSHADEILGQVRQFVAKLGADSP